jgi:hypothetical protein
MVSVAVACLPTAVSLLLLEVLFMQISGVSLTLTWPCRLCLLRVLLCGSLCYKLSPFQAHWGRCHCTRFLRPTCLFTAHMGSGSSPFSCGVFVPPPLLQVFPLLITGRFCYSCQLQCLFTAHVGGGSYPPLLWSFPPSTTLTRFSAPGAGRMPLLPPARLFYLQFREGFPSPNLQRSVRSTLFPTCLYCSNCLLLSFSFFPGWRSVCPGAMLIWPRVVCGSTVVLLSSPCRHLPKPSGHRQLAARGPSWFLHLM